MSENASMWRMGVQTQLLRLFAERRLVSATELAFSLTSPPHSHPGRCGYLRRVLCALHQIVTPLDGLGVGARSRRNLALMRYRPYPARLR